MNYGEHEHWRTRTSPTNFDYLSWTPIIWNSVEIIIISLFCISRLKENWFFFGQLHDLVFENWIENEKYTPATDLDSEGR